jgi:hypothetical protein
VSLLLISVPVLPEVLPALLCDGRALATAGAPGTGKNPVQRDAPASAPDLLVLFRAGAAVRKRVRCASSVEYEVQLPVRQFPHG